LETAPESDNEITSSESTEESEDGDLFIGKDGTGWSSISPNLQGRTSARNIIQGKVNAAILLPGKHMHHPVDAFSLYFSDKKVDNIVKYTNLHGKKWKMTDMLEICAFIGLLIDAGLRRQSGTCYE